MIKLSDGGAYLINGVDIVEDSASAVNEVAAKTGCSVTKEEAAKNTAGVKDAVVNFMTLKMNVEFEEGQDPKTVMQEVLKNCRKVEDDCEIYL